MPKDHTLAHVALDKELRRDIDTIIQRLKAASARAVQPKPTIGELENILATEGSKNVDVLPSGEVAVGVRASRERSLVITKLQEAVMWLGMDLKAIAEENPEVDELKNPYPHSKDPASTVIDKTADGLKL